MDRQTDTFLVHNQTSDTHYIADELTGAGEWAGETTGPLTQNSIILIKDANPPSLPELSNSMQK